MRVLVVGTGFGRRVVAPAFATLDGVDVVDVVSARDHPAVDAAIREHHPDLVSVHSPPFLHRRHVERALDAGAAVLCDKPLGVDAADSARMLAAAEASGRLHAVNFELRFLPARRRLRDALTAGAVGAVERVTWTHLSAGTRVPLRPYGWLFDAARGGGWVGAWASHAVDALGWLLGTEPLDVTTVSGIRRCDVPERVDADGARHVCTAEDGVSAVLGLGSGVTVTFESGFAAVASLAPRLTVAGSDGVVECVADRTVVSRRADGERTVLFDASRDDDTGDRHAEPMHRYARVVRDALTGALDPHEGLPSFRTGHAVDVVLDRLRSLPLVTRP